MKIINQILLIFSSGSFTRFSPVIYKLSDNSFGLLLIWHLHSTIEVWLWIFNLIVQHDYTINHHNVFLRFLCLYFSLLLPHYTLLFKHSIISISSTFLYTTDNANKIDIVQISIKITICIYGNEKVSLNSIP